MSYQEMTTMQLFEQVYATVTDKGKLWDNPHNVDCDRYQDGKVVTLLQDGGSSRSVIFPGSVFASERYTVEGEVWLRVSKDGGIIPESEESFRKAAIDYLESRK